MDVQWIKLGIDAAQFALTGVVAVYVYWANHAQARRKELRELADRIDARIDGIDLRLARIDVGLGNSPSLEACAAHRGRVDVLEQLISQRPGHDDMKRVHARIDEVSGIVSEVRGRLTGIERSLETITQHLLDSVRGSA